MHDVTAVQLHNAHVLRDTHITMVTRYDNNQGRRSSQQRCSQRVEFNPLKGDETIRHPSVNVDQDWFDDNLLQDR